MILCIDIGNSQILMGIFTDDKLITQFRYNSDQSLSADQFGIFVKAVLVENKIDYNHIRNIVICSVVPELDYWVSAACIKYFALKPLFLNIEANIGLKLEYSNAYEIGADRIATAIAANYLYPNENLIVVDMGTATTICAINKHKEYLGGAILAGLKLQVRSLTSSTAKLPSVEITKPQNFLGKSTKENVQIGLFYGHLGSIKEVIAYITKHAFDNKAYLTIGTGGFSALYRSEHLFDFIIPELVLIGLYQYNKLNS